MTWTRIGGAWMWVVYLGILATSVYALLLYPQRSASPRLAALNNTVN